MMSKNHNWSLKCRVVKVVFIFCATIVIGQLCIGCSKENKKNTHSIVNEKDVEITSLDQTSTIINQPLQVNSEDYLKNSSLTVVGNYPEIQAENDSAKIMKQIFDASLIDAETFNASLRDFSQQPDNIKFLVIGEMINKYSALPKENYQDRWAIVWLLSEMTRVNDPQALKMFQDILAKPIFLPPLQGTDTFSPYREEVTIYLTALEGLWRLARARNQVAQEALFKSASHPEYAVRRMAVSYFLEQAIDKDSAKKRLLEILTPQEHFFLEIKTINEPLPPPLELAIKPSQNNYNKLLPPTVSKAREVK